MPTASKVLVRVGESALGRTSIATAATFLSSLKAEEGTISNSNMVEHEPGPGDNVGDDVSLSATMKAEEDTHDMSGNSNNNMNVEDDEFGVVKIFGETTSLRYEIQQLKIFHETYGKSPTPNENRRLNELCGRLRQIRRDPKKAHIPMGNVKSGEQLSDDIVSELDSFNFEWNPNKNRGQRTLQVRIQELKAYRREKHGPLPIGTKKRKGNQGLSRFSADLRQSRRHPDKPKYQLSESDLSELDSFGFEWELADTAAKQKAAKQQRKSSTKVNSRAVVSSEVRLPTQTRSGRAIKRKSPIDLATTSSKKLVKSTGMEGEQGEYKLPCAEDDTFGNVSLFGETTSLRYELEQLKIFHEQHGKSPTPSENRRLSELCKKIRGVRRNPKKGKIKIGNVRPGEQLSDEIISMLDSFNFVWDPASWKTKKRSNTLQDLIQELKESREKYGPNVFANGKRKGDLIRFCGDLRQSRKNPDNPKYQLGERDISELNSIGFEWDKAPSKPRAKKPKTLSNMTAGPPADGRKYTQLEVINISLVHGKTRVIDAISKSSYFPYCTELKGYFPGANQCFADDIVEELLSKHKVGSDEWHTKVDRIVESKHGPSKAHIFNLFNYTKE